MGAAEAAAGWGQEQSGAGTWGVRETISLFVTLELGAEGKKNPTVGSYKKQRGRR